MPDNKRDLSEDLFEAISTITNKYLEGLHYDKTILCTITDASKAKDGEYMVSDGNADFTAYSDNTKYKEKNSVYVTIPQGDFDNKRIIIGKYQKEDAGKPYNYIAPMDNFVNITENIFIPKENIEAGLLANGEEKRILIGTINTNLSYAGYNRLGIKADFKTLLNSFNVETGNYGLLLEVFDSNSTETTGSYLMQLDCAEMFGNVYNFPGFTSQEKVFDISNSLPIEKIKVYLYQKNNFYDISGEKVPIQIKDKFNNLFDVDKNIFVDNININFGYDLSSFDNNSILLYTLNGKTYSSSEDLKQVKMRWIREIDGQLTILDDNDDLYKIKDTNFKIHWYRWKLEQNINDELAGLFWEEMEDNDSYFLKEIQPNTMAQQERIKIGIEFLPLNNDDDENVAIEYIESEVLEFNNENQAPSAATLDLIKSLTLRTSDEYNGIYAIYGQNNSLMNEHEAKVKRYLIASYESIITGNSGLDNIEGIEWKVPATNTMIQVKDSDEQKWTLSDDKKYYISTNQYEVLPAEAGEEILRELQMLYTIAPVYSQLDTNNTIICTVFKNGLSYISEFEMSFAISGTNGTDYTLIIEIEDSQNKNAIALSGDNNTLQIKVGVQDYSHQLVKNVWYNPSFLMNTMETNFSINQLLDKDGFARFEIKRNGNIVEPEPLILLIKASIPTESKSIILEGYLPIPQVSNDNLIKYSLEGPTKIIYSEAGQNPVYTKKPYCLFNEDGISQDITCEILEDDGGWPTLTGNTLIPALIYCIKKNNFPYVKIKIDDNNYWIQPLLIIINRFGSSMFNKWDGSLQIDEEGNKILSSVMAAGKKEDDNSFSGLLMGEVGKANGSNNNNIGLMGYQKGVRTFFLDSKTGNAILGSSGGGQITLSGESGTITSGNYKSNESGMQIDLTKGKIDAFNFKLTSKNIILDSTDENNNLFLLKNDNNNELIKISSRDFFLQSANFNNEDSGFKLDLEKGTITGFNSKLQFKHNIKKYTTKIEGEEIEVFDCGTVNNNNKRWFKTLEYVSSLHSGSDYQGKMWDNVKLENSSDGTITTEKGWIITPSDNLCNFLIDSNSDTEPLKIGNHFTVNWDGILKASAGLIGGWQIDENKLTSNAGSVGMAKWVGNDKPIFWSGYKAYNKSDWRGKVGFGVSGKGELFANEGAIGGWQITNTGFQVNNDSLYTYNTYCQKQGDKWYRYYVDNQNGKYYCYNNPKNQYNTTNGYYYSTSSSVSGLTQWNSDKYSRSEIESKLTLFTNGNISADNITTNTLKLNGKQLRLGYINTKTYKLDLHAAFIGTTTIDGKTVLTPGSGFGFGKYVLTGSTTLTEEDSYIPGVIYS